MGAAAPSGVGGLTRPKWKSDRELYALETGAPGIFAVGDVRSGSVKRVAAAVGEGGMAIAFVHKYLQAATV
jgi:thioredoxin reductase (NADPH)